MSGSTGRGIHGSTVNLLGARIVDGTWPPGATLDLTEIGTELGVSLTALREAIKVLRAKGLVDAWQKRGTFVRPREDGMVLDAEVMRWRYAAERPEALLQELSEIRAAIEPAAAALAARRRDEADITAVRAGLAAIEAASAGTTEEMAAADRSFHRALLAATHNEMFARMSVVVDPALSARNALVHGHTVDDPVPSHTRLADAVIAGDETAASSAALALLDQSAADAARALEEGDTPG